MDFKSYLKETARELDQEIENILGDWLKEVEKTSPKLVPLAQAFIKACQGGKRIRGTLVKLGYEIAMSSWLDQDLKDSGVVPQSGISQNDNSEVIKIGAAYEIFHAAILAHDDISDLSPLRRGQKSLYRALGGNHHGISQAINLGDAGYFLATKVISESDFPDKEKNKALAHFSKTMVATATGQMLDIELPHLGGKRVEEDVIKIMKLKTGQYSASAPLQIGAILAGVDQKLLGCLGLFGENLGIAFQIQDDILGVFGDEKELGKSTTSDIEEGKNTLLITEALKRANPAQREILDKYYGKGDQGNLGDRGVKEIRKVFLETGSLDYSRQKGVKYVLRAKSIIPKITKDKRWLQILTEMADFLVQRSK